MKDQHLIEQKIRIQVESTRSRLPEFFIDYDRLRSGFVTRTQFHRILDTMLKDPKLTSHEIEYLSNKYDTKSTQQSVNYREFIAAVINPFPDNDLKANPDSYTYKNPEYLGTFRSVQTLSPNEEILLKSLLNDLNSYYAKKNIEVLTFFRDFDRNSIGLVTEKQFRRSLTDPPMSDEQIELIVKKYSNPDVKSKGSPTVNYLNFFNDVKSDRGDKSAVAGLDSNFITSVRSQMGPEAGLSILEIVDRISIACHKEGIRIGDFFKDYDRLRCGLITDRQFASGLTAGVQKQANLCIEDIAQLTEYYRHADGRCDYKSFSETVENVFNIPDMEKKPLSHVNRPARGLLAKTLNGNLTPSEQDEVELVLAELAELVRKYKLQVFPYFKDYDRSTAFTRNVSKIQFGRVLSTLQLMPSNERYELLCLKFQDPVNGDINYPAFCQAIDEDYKASRIGDISPPPDQPEYSTLPIDTTDVDMNHLMGKIRSFSLANRLRIKEFFQDMDPLNSGFITKTQFIRCASSLGCSSIGKFNITPAECEALCKQYINLMDTRKCAWKRFESDVESVFTVRELEKNPNLFVAPQKLFVMPPAGTIAWNEDKKINSSENYRVILDNLKDVIERRRLDCWPPFKDFDSLNRGHVTIKQFEQCLSKLGLTVEDKDLQILEAKFVDNIGFFYVAFLSELQPNLVEEPKYAKFIAALHNLSANEHGPFESNPQTDIQSILAKIKDQVFKKRVSIYEWLRDHDKLNCGRLTKETFNRAINLCNLDLQMTETEILVNYYTSKKDSNTVEYKTFCREIESAFGDHEVEKNPLLNSEQHVSVKPYQINRLAPDDEDLAAKSLTKIAERVRSQRMQLFPLFEDFDQVKNGYVSQNQFRRVLNDLNLVSLLRNVELDALMRKYCVRIGHSRDDVNYVSLCDKIYELGSFEYRKP